MTTRVEVQLRSSTEYLREMCAFLTILSGDPQFTETMASARRYIDVAVAPGGVWSSLRCPAR